MGSGNAQIDSGEVAQTASGNTGGPLALAAGVVAEALVAYEEQLARAPLAASSRRKYRSRVAGFLLWLAESDIRGDPLADTAARDWAVRDYRLWLKGRKIAPTTINATLAAVDDFYTRRGLGPAKARREELVARSAPRALSPQDARRFLRAVEQTESSRDRLLGLLPYYAGLRIGEVVALDLDDVRLSARKGEIRVLGKGRDGGKVRLIPVHAELKAALERWLADRASWVGAASAPALLLNARGGRMSDRYARSVVEALGRLAELAGQGDPLAPHVLRHTFGTQLVRSGVDLVTVAELMGHARLDTTRVYTLPTMADRERALLALVTDG